MGDGTTSVVIVAAELLKRANELIKNNIHPTTVMAGYRLALKEAVKYIKANLCVPVDKLGRCVGYMLLGCWGGVVFACGATSRRVWARVSEGGKLGVRKIQNRVFDLA